ncbi:helix-turn-helix domain-containing protein [Winogradskyella sp. UBA3174]|uniref:helix-turn-helix domain-containing protein n=1 Tax=Winogradskyella sp. UBA3174 TaxID=1947785 RepID=UPI0025FB63F8|nr:helix-turn-helix domain-containing protein [Winogradskyella sp. UBA3174]
MAFRIGKSVMLNFGGDLEPLFIFAGLAFLLVIGPLLRWYVLAMTRPNFKLHKSYYLELVPFVFIFILSFFINKNWFDTNNKQVIILFGSVLIFIYLHLAFYIFSSGRIVYNLKKKNKNSVQTKSQISIIAWLNAVIIGFIVIWVSYFLNIIDDTVPYITGPIVYSIAIYFLSYKAFQFKVTDIDGDVFKLNDKTALFNKISKLVIDKKLYLETDLSLSSVSKLIGKTTQTTSEVINQYAKQNFNDFINYHRIQDAKKLLLDVNSTNFTISSIAFDIGFSSLSSFNSAFKKFENTTPSSYRNTGSV